MLAWNRSFHFRFCPRNALSSGNRWATVFATSSLVAQPLPQSSFRTVPDASTTTRKTFPPADGLDFVDEDIEERGVPVPADERFLHRKDVGSEISEKPSDARHGPLERRLGSRAPIDDPHPMIDESRAIKEGNAHFPRAGVNRKDARFGGSHDESGDLASRRFSLRSKSVSARATASKIFMR